MKDKRAAKYEIAVEQAQANTGVEFSLESTSPKVTKTVWLRGNIIFVHESILRQRRYGNFEGKSVTINLMSNKNCPNWLASRGFAGDLSHDPEHEFSPFLIDAYLPSESLDLVAMMACAPILEGNFKVQAEVIPYDDIEGVNLGVRDLSFHLKQVGKVSE